MSKSEAWSSEREALAVEALRHSGYLRLRVTGASMLPTLWPGDVVEIESCPGEEVGRDEILFAFRDSRFFLHRFVSGDGNRFVTRGDSMPGPDPAFPANSLLGIMVSVHRDGREVEICRRPWTRVMGLVFCNSSIARRAALWLRRGSKTQDLPVASLENA